VIVVLLVGWLVLAWAVLKRPILALPIAVFTVLIVLVGLQDVQALTIYALGALWIWRCAHRASFERLVGRRVRSGWVHLCTYERRWRDTMLLRLFGEMTIALTLKRHEFVAGESIAASVSVGGGWEDKLRAIDVELGYSNTYLYERFRSSSDDGDASDTENAQSTTENAQSTKRVIVATEIFPVDHARTSAGPSTFDVTLALPIDAPATAQGWVEWSVTAILVRRLRLGRRQKVPITVLASPFAHTAWAKAKQVSDAGCNMFLELPGCVARVGETLSGVLHVSPKYQFEARSVRVELERLMRHEDGIVSTRREAKVIVAACTTFVPGDPQQIPFQITIPTGATPSLRAKHNEIRWYLKGICARSGLLHRNYCVKAELLVTNAPPESALRALGLGAKTDKSKTAPRTDKSKTAPQIDKNRASTKVDRSKFDSLREHYQGWYSTALSVVDQIRHRNRELLLFPGVIGVVVGRGRRG